MPSPEDKDRLRHMLSAAQKALKFAERKRREDLDDNEMLCLALVRSDPQGDEARETIEAQLGEVATKAAREGVSGPLARIAEVRAELADAEGDRSRRTEHLREAQRIYESYGAHGHAQRIARLFDSL